MGWGAFEVSDSELAMFEVAGEKMLLLSNRGEILVVFLGKVEIGFFLKK